ncbi:unnamed protein product, partial [marine sediment metagenome]
DTAVSPKSMGTLSKFFLSIAAITLSREVILISPPLNFSKSFTP